MRVLFDQGTPVPLRQYLPDHSVTTVFEKGWNKLENAALLRAAEQELFEILITTDQNLKHQQNLENYRLAIIILTTTSWPVIQKHITKVTAAIHNARPSSFAEVVF